MLSRSEEAAAMVVPFAAQMMPRIDPERPGFAEAWESCALFLEGVQARKKTELRLAELRGRAMPGSLSGTAMGARLAGAARELIAALAEGEFGGQRGGEDCGGKARAAIAALVGLGPGLTPSGDDFLCGLAAALRCRAAEPGESDRFLAALRELLPELSSRTTAVGAAYLGSAAAGAFAPAIIGLARAFSGEAGDRAKAGDGGDAPEGAASAAARAALDELCAIGHSSGSDAATGLLVGLGSGMEWARREYAP